jgi:two-component system chemotaxis response regulator CheY
MVPLILVVDDDDFIREVLREMLSKYELVEADNGGRAVQVFKEKHPRLVLMDILMPEMDGIEATRKIMQIDDNAVILGISAFAAVKGEQMLKAGAREILSKPVRMQELRKKIEEYLEDGG